MSTSARRVVFLLAMSVLAAGCGGGSRPPAATGSKPEAAGAAGALHAAVETDAEKVVNVYNWSDYIDNTVIDEFQKEFGIHVNYDVFDSNEVLETKLLAGSTGYDIVVPSGPFLERQIKAGVYQPLDKSRIPNLKNMDPDLTARVALHDPGNAYSVNYLWGSDGVGYNVDMISKRMPDAPLDSWRMLYDPAVVSKFADCGVTVLDAPTEVVGTVLIYLGKDANSENPEDLKAAEDVLMKIRQYIRSVNSAKYIEDLANGEICLSLGWSGDVLQSRNRANEASKGINVSYRIPKEGAVMFFDMLAIPKDAEHPLNAHLFINFLMRPEIAARNSSFRSYANSNAASYPLVAEEVRNDPSIYPTPEIKAKLVPERAKSPEFTRLLTRSWTRFKTGK